MERENAPRIDVEELIRKAEPVIRAVSTVFAVGKIIQAKVNSLTFEEQLLSRYNQLTNMGLTEEQARATLNQSIENMLARGMNTNQGGNNHE